ncbi:hypothetical protein IV203_025547 [Nitzschia inconspicua]|uniref:DUF7869 domain-containing protein n=1 Tax=Nitzschia inconspicua TaxID=303405 RepID=A0A9K3LJ79_9STRA|nr:hypothetical protein IV203_025547 [Nitzschia inconspicua]
MAPNNRNTGVATERQGRSHVFSAPTFMKGKKKNQLEPFIELNHKLVERGCCVSKSTCKGMTCHCLQILSDEVFSTAVAEYQVMFHTKKQVEQKKVVIEWLRNGSDKMKSFRIPFIVEPYLDYDYDPLRKASVCLNALMDILAKGRDFWMTCVRHHKEGTYPEHKNVCRMSNKKRQFLQTYEKELDEHFEELKREAEPIATRYVREVTGESTLRDGEDNMLYLPPFMTMRRCYGNFCLDKRGMRVITTNNGNTSFVPATPNGETKRVPSWSGYCTYWKDNYRNLRIRKPTEDICNYCYKIYNFHKFRSTEKESSVAEEGKEPENLEELFEERVHQLEEEDGVDFDQFGNDSTNPDDPITVTKEVEKMERKLLEAAMHVRKARAMRALVNQKIALARKDRKEEVPHSERVYTLIADFCQNMELPHFGAVQPGETYFLTPAKLEGFGVADVSHVGDDGKEADHLYFHCYQEGDGAKGGTNVASMIMKTLKKTEIIRTDENGGALRAKELNIVMDNCAGQKKNNYVLLLAPYLVEMGYFTTVNMLFLVVGHTKNVCDRRFNNLKQVYHNSQVFTTDQAVEVLGSSEYVTVWKIDPQNDWKNYAKFLLEPYLKLHRSKISIARNHIFCAEWIEHPQTSDGVTMKFHTRESSLEEHGKVYADKIINPKFASNGDRREKLKSVAPPPIIYNGLPGYKQILLHKSYKEL